MVTYGEMTTLSMGTRTWVLLNSNRVMNEGKSSVIRRFMARTKKDVSC